MNYSKLVDYAAKDLLLHGDAAKAIKGTEVGAEFDAIATMSATKVDSGGALGTPSSGTLTNCTGLPVSTGISGLGTGVATFLATPSSANLASAVTGETGSGALVFATSPALVTPALGTPSSGTLTNCTGLPQAGTVGLTTADSPQFTAVNIGHATDTTLTRVSAGVAAIEGATILTGTASQHIQITRDMTLASGNVAYTGIGFTPKCLIAFATIDGSTATSFGMSTGTTEHVMSKFGGAASTQNLVDAIIYVSTDASSVDYQTAQIASLDADGFTLTWTKVGTPTGTLTANVLAFK